MFTSKSHSCFTETGKADMLVPFIRAAATIGFAVAPCSLGFVIVAVSEHLIRSIMVGDDPEMLVSDLQNEFPDESIKVSEGDDLALVADVVKLIGRSGSALDLPPEIPAGTTLRCTFLAEQIAHITHG